MLLDCHMHTPLCGHASGAPREYVRAAAAKGIKLITFTCHIPLDDPAFGGPGIRMARSRLAEYVDLIADAAAFGKTLGVEVLRGIEGEIFPDTAVMAEVDAVLAAQPFDFVLGSLHHPLRGYRAWLARNNLTTDRAIVQTYFAHLAEGARSRRFHSMSHPDVIRIYDTVSAFEPADYEPCIRAFLSALVEADVCMEVNTSGLIKGAYKVHPDPLILDWAHEYGVKITLGSDAHRPEQVGQHFDTVVPLLRSKGFTQAHYFRGGVRHAVDLG